MIEEDVEKLQTIVRGIHGRIGHVWAQSIGTLSPIAICACGETNRVSKEEFAALPQSWDLDSQF